MAEPLGLAVNLGVPSVERYSYTFFGIDGPYELGLMNRRFIRLIFEILKEDRKPCPRIGAVYFSLQFLQDTRSASLHSGNESTLKVWEPKLTRGN